MRRIVCLIVLDGWGIAPAGPGNAISLAKTPNFNRFWSLYPHTNLSASGESVGLPRGENGNTETGHLNLGAGSIIYQDLPRINMSIADGSFFKIEAFQSMISHLNKNNSSLHIIGLVGAGGVHSNVEHLYALLNLCKEQKISKVYIHAITDGRDSPPTQAIEYLTKIDEETKKLAVGQIASITGRYYAMDRDRRWARTEKSYDALTLGNGVKAESYIEAINKAYQRGETDEFISPTNIIDNDKPVALVKDNDAVVFFNFRIDRPRQLTKAFVLQNFETEAHKTSFDPYSIKYYKTHLPDSEPKYPLFNRKTKLNNLLFITMTEYEKNLPVTVAFPPQYVQMPLGRVISDKNLKQLRVSETEKERFVTYYFNGLREQPFPYEEKMIIPSPQISTYDLKPEMSAYELTDALINKINADSYVFYLVNFANPDMVGHTGVIPAAVKAIEVTDDCIGKIVRHVLSLDGTCLITADHGNVEEMIDLKSGGIDTEHSINPVPCIIINREFEGKPTELKTGILADVAPTILHLLEIPKTHNMTGRNLLQSL